jgi:hypothetical protein
MKFIIELDDVEPNITPAKALKLVDIDKLNQAFDEIEYSDLHISLTKIGEV